MAHLKQVIYNLSLFIIKCVKFVPRPCENEGLRHVYLTRLYIIYIILNIVEQYFHADTLINKFFFVAIKNTSMQFTVNGIVIISPIYSFDIFNKLSVYLIIN